MKFRLQSLNDVVTNSSMEVYQEATQYTVDAVRDIINVILKIGGSDKSCDDLFTVSINYEDMLESYFEDILGKSDIDEIHLDTIEEIRCRKDNTGHFISDSEAYAELVKIGLVGNMNPPSKSTPETLRVTGDIQLLRYLLFLRVKQSILTLPY